MARLVWNSEIKNELQEKFDEMREVKELMPAENEEEQEVIWILFGTDAPEGKVNRSKDVKIFESGKTYEALEKKLSEATNQIYFAFVRFYLFDVYKWILITWTGKKVSMILRGQVFQFQESIKKEFKGMGHTVTHKCTYEQEFSSHDVMAKLKKSAGVIYSGGNSLEVVETTVVISTFEMIQEGNMLEECEDLVFLKFGSLNETYEYWIESGCNTSHTIIWLRIDGYPSGIFELEMHHGDQFWHLGMDRRKSTFGGEFIFPSTTLDCPEGYTPYTDESDRHIRISSVEYEEGNLGGTDPSDHDHLIDVSMLTTGDMSSYGAYYETLGVDWHRLCYFDHLHDEVSSFLLESVDVSLPKYKLQLCKKTSGETGQMLMESIVVMNTNESISFSDEGYMIRMDSMDGFFLYHSISEIGLSTGSLEHQHSVRVDQYTGETAFPGYQDGTSTQDIRNEYGNERIPVKRHNHQVTGNFTSESHVPPYRNIIFYEVIEHDLFCPPKGVVALTHDKSIPMGWEDISSLYEGKFLRGGVDPSVEGGTPSHHHELIGSVLGTRIFGGELSTCLGPNYCTDNDPGTYRTSKFLDQGDIAFGNHTHDIDMVDGSPYLNLNNTLLQKYRNFALFQRKDGTKYPVQIGDALEMNWLCFDISKDCESVCSGSGLCWDTDMCICKEEHYGDECQEHIGQIGYCEEQRDYYFGNNDEDDEAKKYEVFIQWEVGIVEIADFQIYAGSMEGEFNCNVTMLNVPQKLGESAICRWRNEKLTRTTYMVIETEKNILEDYENELSINVIPITERNRTVEIRIIIPSKDEEDDDSSVVTEVSSSSLIWILLVPILSSVFTYIVFCQIMICCTGCCLLLCCCCCFMEVMCPCIGCIYYKQRMGLKRFSRLKNIDLLLREQELDDDVSIAHLRINKNLFEIDYDEIELVKIVGEGGSNSVVYRAKWNSQVVAFKCFKTRAVCNDQDTFDEFETEVEILGSVSHPNILQFYGCSLKPPRVGIVMEFCENGDFGAYLLTYKSTHSEEKSVDLMVKMRLLLETCLAMNYLHSRKIIHRDLKLENVLIDKNITAKLVDFGLSKMIDRMSQTKTRSVGTSYYMAPELIHSDIKHYNELIDVFSFGIMFYMSVTENFHPYGLGDHTHSIEIRVANDPNLRPNLSYFQESIHNYIITDHALSEDKKKLLRETEEIVKICWDQKNERRPSFEDLTEIFKLIVQSEENNKDHQPTNSIEKPSILMSMVGGGRKNNEQKNEVITSTTMNYDVMVEDNPNSTIEELKNEIKMLRKELLNKERPRVPFRKPQRRRFLVNNRGYSRVAPPPPRAAPNSRPPISGDENHW